ncbi:hypothetical protein BBK36DRAFT_1185870 [Trichoderma citrinoviride]|uniref:Uncharacterized protein n=1 Tax=Trichoderma citrinoviride TaxID=58853 RepID=A0A2T4AZ12_9HYPO|nr:hypothetical protein BBK36DRAFT_1185870 [Trichoderma citrinoviride]PTB62218.1 hypothetical protein BBK36DRAFT_1185870 [Trichoderma citrinoviride]
MANRGELDVKLLRDATPREQALHLRHVLDSNPAATSSLTAQLISLVAAETLPPIVLGLWPSVANQPEVTVAVIRQELCVNAQQLAIKHLHRHLRREKTFANAWEAAGGARGVAQLAAKLSVDNVRLLLGLLGSTARAQGGRKQRQREMEKLLELLWGQHEDSAEGVALDGRPLREIYLKLLPACGGAFRVKWEEDQKRQLQERHGASVVTDFEFFESHYDEELRRKEITGEAFLDKIGPLVLHRTEYGLQVLERFLDSENLLGVSPGTLFDAVVNPLGKRFLSRRRISNDTTLRFWTCLILGLKERSAFQKNFQGSEHYFRTMITRLVEVWNRSRNRSRARAEYTEMLPTLFSALPEAMVTKYALLDLLRNVGEVRRYQLLRLFLKHTAGNRVDIGEPTSLEHAELEKKSSFGWQSDIFFLLPAEEALSLWEKVQRAGKDIGRTSSFTQRFLYQRPDPEQREVADRHVVRALLLSQIRRPAVSAFSSAELDAMRAEARQEVSRRMKKATQGRSFEDRSQAALSALDLSVATGDLELYAETLRWARRFNKDPLTIKELYSQQSLLTREGEDVLAVLHKKMKDELTVDKLTMRIQSANAVLSILFETASMGVNEPSFSPRDWQPTFELIKRVVCLRLNWVNDFQDRTKMSDDSLYEAVWKPTSAMLEKMLSDHLGPVGDRFEPLTPHVTLSSLRVTEPQKLRGHTIRFLNHLAEFQDSLWADLRRRETPALVTVDEIWPKGATLQQLSSYFGEALAHLSYGQARIEAVVFMGPSTALQPVEVDEAAQLAIGTFVDSWSTALQLYIQMPGEERKKRIQRAWRHATVALSKDRMSPDEAERFWWPVFESVGVQKYEVGINDDVDERPQPSLPDVREDEHMQPIEWNPDPEYDHISQPEKDKALAPVLLDVLLSRPTEESTARFIKAQRAIFGDVKAVVPAKPRPCSFWALFLESQRKLSGKSADAYAAAAILAMNMKHGSDRSLLKTPYPHAEAVRIPAVYLDQDFLERSEKTPYVALEQPLGVLAGLKYYTPTGLLVQLAESILKSIKKNSPMKKPFWEFQNIISFILDGKDPSLATPLIQRLILENPGESSWHRVVLNRGILAKLSPAVAKDFFESFTNAILDRLQAREDLQADKEAGDDAPAGKAPLVKITTIKMLAQLLRESPVVDPSLAVDLNIRILKRSSHVDVRTASVKGLMEAIKDSATSSAVKKRIFDALREYAVPIASSVNESQPVTDWDSLRPEDDLPEIWEDGIGTATVPPIMSLILDAGHLAMDYLLLRTNPPEWLTAITQAVRDNKKLAYINAGKHWSHMWSSDGGFDMKILFWRILQYLRTVKSEVERGEIQKRGGYQSMDAYIFDIADAVLMQGQLAKFEAFMTDTAEYNLDSRVWGRIVERINGLRTPAWQADPNRKPAVLPDTLGLRIRMLDLPRSSHATPDEAKETVARCAEGVVKLLEEIVADQKPYARRFDTLQKGLEGAELRAEMGIALAATPALDDVSVVALVDYLRLELAVGLLERSHIFKTGLGPPYEEDVVKRATEVVTKMTGSVVEEFRMLAAPLQRSIENTDGWDWWC